MDVVVEVGGWEHECCGDAIERNELVDFQCIRFTAPDGRLQLIESHHGGLGVAADERVHGRVTEIEVVDGAGGRQAVHRVPSGRALRGFDPDDDGHLEAPWTGEPVTAPGLDFLVTVRTSR
ncbi:DUF6578 domain-containing protein [Blastococcus sp. LR1]|uniref:DUF6578 domain-containing protein n=1 Tax=Blastococcus sp. LR1 TaxID=2877000 RepID=UPI001CCF2859|nr:DUF6578 domain-containing protein [Blastococcus sp. LR1]MCA0145393.1 hypothetical protein [Blastococcus sp. LR1]